MNRPSCDAPQILVADPYPVFRYGMERLINDQPDMACCGLAGSIPEVRTLIEKLRPRVLTMGLRLQHGDALGLIKEIRDQHPLVSILVVSDLDEAVYAPRVLLCGGSGFLSKTAPLETLPNAIRIVLSGEIYLSPQMAVRLLRQTIGRHGVQDSSRHAAALSDRELQIFQMLGVGLCSREIASDLGISIKTVDSHRENIKHKLGMHDAAELIRQAVHFVDAEGATGTHD